MKIIYPSIIKHQPREISNKNLIFFHIPKSGGTTLDAILSSLISYSELSFLRLPVLDYFPPVLMKNGWKGSSQSFQKLDKIAAYVSGHFSFGSEKSSKTKFDYITLINHPIKREISSCNHHYERNLIPLYSNIIEFIEAQNVVDNPQTRMLAGVDAFDLKVCNSDTLAKAKSNIENNVFYVGLSEHFDRFLSALLGVYRWPAVAYARQQVGRRKALNEVSHMETLYLQDYHRFDFELYNYAIERWENWARENVIGVVEPQDKDPIVCINKYYEVIKHHVVLNYPLKDNKN